MQTTKKWYQSKTIWGIVIGVIGILLTKLGVPDVSLPANADVNQIQTYVQQVKDANGNIATIGGDILAAIGTITAIIGRIKADEKIG